MKQFFDTLNVAQGAPMQEVRRAWRRKAMAYHPDRQCQNIDAANDFHQARMAYEEIAKHEAIESIKRIIREYHQSHLHTNEETQKSLIPVKPERIVSFSAEIQTNIAGRYTSKNAKAIKSYEDTRNMNEKSKVFFAVA